MLTTFAMDPRPPTYRAILRDSQLVWLDAPPNLPANAELHITLAEPAALLQGDAMAAALEKLAQINAFQNIEPAEWQRDICQSSS